MSDPSLDPSLDPTRSVFVHANAGSGKTYILVTRLVRLMLGGAAPEKLLCLTYTRSAAAEMQNRLFDLLSEWALLDDAELAAAINTRLAITPDSSTLRQARVLFARALETPGGLKVQTIHAFCESLLKRFPLEAGVSPQFELQDAEQAGALQIKILKQIFAKQNDEELSQALALISRECEQETLYKLSGGIIANRRAFGSYPQNPERLAEFMGIKLPAPEPAAIVEGFLDGETKTINSFIAWLNGGGVNDKKQAARLADWQAVKTRDAQSGWEHLRGFFLKKDGASRPTCAGKKLLETSAGEGWQDLFIGWQKEFYKTHEYYLTMRCFQLTRALHIFADAYLEAYAAAKHRAARLDYDDLIYYSEALLRQRSSAQWVLYKLDQNLAHILVDEAQDTAPAQWRLIAALVEEFFSGEGAYEEGEKNDKEAGEPRTIFAVGDEKQSIFSFQGADPAAFAAQFNKFKQQNPAMAQAPLLKSWRAAPPLLQFVDELFADKEKLLGAGAPIKHIPTRDDAGGRVELWDLATAPTTKRGGVIDELLNINADDEINASPRAVVANNIADKISTLINDGYQSGDMLILVRKRDAFVEDMIRALKRRQIPVSGADRMVLSEQIIIMDLLALASFACAPHDDLTLACLLRSPFCGISEEQLFELAHSRGVKSLWQVLTERAKSDKSFTNFTKAHSLCLWALQNIDYLPPFDFFTRFLNRLDDNNRSPYGAARRRLGAQIDDPLAEFLRAALDFENPQAGEGSSALPVMQNFLHYMGQDTSGGGKTIKRDMEGGGAAVRIMTIHAAKGLEAPIVFLPDTAGSAGGNARPAPIVFGRNDEGGDSAPPLWRAAKDMQDANTRALCEEEAHATACEAERLLYVALTRACDQIYIGGYLRRGGKKPADDSWYAQCSEVIKARGVEIKESGKIIWRLEAGELVANNSASTEQGKNKIDAAALPEWIYQPAKQVKVKGEEWLAPSSIANKDAPHRGRRALFSSGDEALDDSARAMQRGTLAHKLLEILPPLEKAQRVAAARIYLASAGTVRGVFSPAEQDKIIDEVISLLDNPALAKFFTPAPATKTLAEVSICGTLGAHKLNGQIDLYYEDAQEIILIDYKSGALVKHDGAHHLLEQYETQMACYRALVSSAQKTTKPIRCALLSIASGELMMIDPKILDAAVAKLT